MPSNGRLLTTAEACAKLDVEPPQLYRWRQQGFLTATLVIPPEGRLAVLAWDPEPIAEAARKLPPRSSGKRRDGRKYLSPLS